MFFQKLWPAVTRGASAGGEPLSAEDGLEERLVVQGDADRDGVAEQCEGLGGRGGGEAQGDGVAARGGLRERGTRAASAALRASLARELWTRTAT